jgi:hypothetical protein
VVELLQEVAMKRFTVLYGGGKCSVEGVPDLVFKTDEDGLENKLVKAVKDRYHCEARQVGIPAEYIETDLPDDYEPCGVCGYDHMYDSPTDAGPEHCANSVSSLRGPRLLYPDLASVPDRSRE